jgi:SAM-dependent methyltransferase
MEPARQRHSVSPLIDLLRCLGCGAPVAVEELSDSPGYPELGPDGVLGCTGCGERYPLIGGTPRMLEADGSGAVRQRTADSFAYEWRHFGAWRPQWEKNFLDYMRPHGPEWFEGRLVLDVGAGSGRHSAEAARLGARVVAVDLGASIDVARANLPSDALTVQADAERLPFAPGSFDLVMSIGVLHHLPDPQRALRSITRYARPGGHVHVYLYWLPERPAHRRIIELVTVVRRLTVRLPYRVLHALSYPLAVALFVAVVLPYRHLRARPRGRRVADALPLKTYADYPFGVLVNDQFDRFSAPLEHRYTKDEVVEILEAAGLADIQVVPNAGWVADGRVTG